ncbi:MAG TPA: heavy metal-binding domain-containing protein [Catenuloplanes sp.]|jgi:uncharacterized protein YbjQ (UPF0145 family)
MLLATTATLPGYDLRVGLGPVSGTGVRAAKWSNAGLALLHEELSREALQPLLQVAAARGANAVVGLHYVLTILGGSGGGTMVIAYGTAAWAAPVTPEAVSQYEAMLRAGQLPTAAPR